MKCKHESSTQRKGLDRVFRQDGPVLFLKRWTRYIKRTYVVYSW